MIIGNLLLQKLSKSSNAKDHLKAFERKLELWKQVNLNELLQKAMTIQKKNLIAITKRYLQSDWLRGVQYWPNLYSILNIFTLRLNKKKTKNTTFDFLNGNIEIYSLETN